MEKLLLGVPLSDIGNETSEYVPIWHSVLDDQTCDECRALHGKPIMGINILPPLHGANDPRGGCRCTVMYRRRTDADMIQESE